MLYFLQKKAAVGYDGGVHVLEVSEADVYTNLVREHHPILSVLATRQRNLRIIFNVWQSKDVKVSTIFFQSDLKYGSAFCDSILDLLFL